MDDATILGRLGDLGLELPPPPASLAAYVPCMIHDGVAYVAGQIPNVDGSVLHPGKLGEHIDVADGADAARRAALQGLSALRHGLGDTFDRLQRILQVTVYVAAVEGFIEHPAVANGASELLIDVLGEQGRHARVAVGVATLPLGASVEVSLTAAVA